MFARCRKNWKKNSQEKKSFISSINFYSSYKITTKKKSDQVKTTKTNKSETFFRIIYEISLFRKMEMTLRAFVFDFDFFKKKKKPLFT